MSLATGTRLGRYEIRAKIGQGGMGEVYLAQDTKLDRKVALKILPAEVASHRDRMRRFVQEAKAASALNHPNIITIYEIDEIDSVNFIAIEFIDGGTLRRRMIDAPLTIREALDLAIQTASALAAAHLASIVHRDIKPENIMLRPDGIAKVLDFGLAKLTERLPLESVDSEAPTSFKTDPDSVVGTAVYMSPEQVRAMPLDARTDIFSLGIVLYEMVTGTLPFPGSTSGEMVASMLGDKEPQPLARYSHEVPIELERIVSKALRRNRDERYQTVRDMVLDLQTLKIELEFERKLKQSAPSKWDRTADAAESETVIDFQPRQTRLERKSATATLLAKPRVALALALLVIVAMGAAGYLYLTRDRHKVISSVAVLPFVNASGSQDAEYLSDGMTESLINSLSHLPELSVKARGTVFRYKDQETDPQRVGSELNVQAVLSGRVVQRGDDLVLSLELVDTLTGDQIWGGHYDRKLTDLVGLQNEIARDVSRRLRVPLSGADKQELQKSYTANAEAYRLYLKGRHSLNQYTEEGLKRSIEYFNQATRIDPGYALAYSGVADAYHWLSSMYLLPNDASPKAKAAAIRALELDPNLGEAHVSLALVLSMYEWQWTAAESEFKRAKSELRHGASLVWALPRAQ